MNDIQPALILFILVCFLVVFMILCAINVYTTWRTSNYCHRMEQAIKNIEIIPKMRQDMEIMKSSIQMNTSNILKLEQRFHPTMNGEEK